MILRFAYLLVSVGKAEKVVRKNANQVRCIHNKLIGGTTLHAIPFYGEMIVLKRRNV